MRNEIESKTLELNMKTQEQAVSQSLNTEPIIAAHHRRRQLRFHQWTFRIIIISHHW